jgi:hypothetical protein
MTEVRIVKGNKLTNARIAIYAIRLFNVDGGKIEKGKVQ